MQTQTDLLKIMEKEFKITRPIFLNIKTGWFDNYKFGSNLVNASEINIPQIQGRYRLNLNDNKLGIQEFFFDLEWSSFDKDNKKLGLITKDITNSYFKDLKKATLKLLNIILKYIPKDYIYIRISGTGLHVIFFVKGLKDIDEFNQISDYIITKTNLPNTKNADKLVFGLDRATILCSDRKIAEFGSWNKVKKDLKKEVDYLNYATYLSVDEFYETNDYPFCDEFSKVNYPPHCIYLNLPEELRKDSKQLEDIRIKPIEKAKKDLNQSHTGKKTSFFSGVLKICNFHDDDNIVSLDLRVPSTEPAYSLQKCPAYFNILRKKETDWYERHFLLKYLKYVLKLSKKEILDLIDKYACWSDYSPKLTRYYVGKHFREGTCETKVTKPIKKKTLIKYKLCKNDCKECVYKKISRRK